MYGLVNRAIENLVRSHVGDDGWLRVCSAAGIERPAFIAMQPYDDAITDALLRSAAEQLGVDFDALLETFGERWMNFTVDEGYGSLLRLMGSSYEEFLDNLDALHVRIATQMPSLQPPHVCREPQPDGSCIVHYRSERQGLAAMVTGMLRGLGRHFDLHVDVERLPAQDPFQARFAVRTRPT